VVDTAAAAVAADDRNAGRPQFRIGAVSLLPPLLFSRPDFNPVCEGRSTFMATRSRTTFKKRQKEMARMEKQRDKAAKRAEKKDGDGPREPEIMSLEEAAALRLG
jgi:hypothetical protein